MNVGFLLNQLSARGTDHAVLSYAKYNKEILGNESTVFTFPTASHDPAGIKLFQDNKVDVWNLGYLGQHNIDILYHIKSGEDDGFRPPQGIKYAVHAVFNYGPHGDKYAMISEWLGRKHNAPWVPHIIDLFDTGDSYRSELGIPEGALVFGRHGAADSFDIPFAFEGIKGALATNPDIYFVFLNTNKPDWSHERVFFLPQTVSAYEKRKFINTSDVMIHARERGETFGIAVGEFAVLGKPVITYGNSNERAHIEGHTYLYHNTAQLIKAFSLDWGARRISKYMECTPEKVMKQFEEVFLRG